MVYYQWGDCEMKLFDKYFQPYAEYCLRTTFSEDELKTVFEKELPHVFSFAAFKAGFEANKFTFFRRSKPFHLHPGITGRNSLRGEIAVKCEKSEYSPETILHITIAPQNISLFCWIYLCFAVMMGILLLCVGTWQAVIPLGMSVFLFVILALCRSAAENEVPKIRQAFENTLRKFEEKYRDKTIEFPQDENQTKKIKFFWIVLLLTVPVVLVLIFDPASTLSLRNFLEDIFGTIFFIDFPIGMCLLHYYYPQFFRHRKSGHYSLVPWGIFFLVCWGIVALGMFLETQFGRYPENGFSVVCAYLFGWAYIWFTMIPIGLIYLLFRCIQKLWNKRGER